MFEARILFFLKPVESLKVISIIANGAQKVLYVTMHLSEQILLSVFHCTYFFSKKLRLAEEGREL